MNSTMRDAFLNRLLQEMKQNLNIFFLSADFGAPLLDVVRRDFPDRFLNVGIAEQNLINVAAGLALEGFRVFTYAIAPFYLRACEQVRINLSMLAQFRTMNLNLLAVGAGCSYVIAGPSHHCFEDISIFRTLPGIEVISPSDSISAAEAFSLTRKEGLRYFRLDSQKLPVLYCADSFRWPNSGCQLLQSPEQPDCVLVSTGYLTHVAVDVARRIAQKGVRCRHLDMLQLKYTDTGFLQKVLDSRNIFTFEEGFIGKGGLDSLIRNLCQQGQRVTAFGIPDRFEFSHGTREDTLAAYGIDPGSIACEIRNQLALS